MCRAAGERRSNWHPAHGRRDADVTAELYDHGANPFVVNVEALTLQNETFRTAVWTGEYLQLTVMSIPVGGEIGLEVHNTIEQFLRIEEGKGLMMMGDSAEELTLQKRYRMMMSSWCLRASGTT